MEEDTKTRKGRGPRRTKNERTEHRVDQEKDEVESVATDSTQLMEERLEQKWAEEVTSDERPAMRECDEDTVVRMIEQHQVYRKIVEGLSAGNDFEVKWMRQEYLRESRETLGMDPGTGTDDGMRNQEGG